jgi:DNA-binding GntR family transcriptional regulator
VPPDALAPIADRPENLTTLVLEAIQRSIIDATIAPGSRISEAALAAQLNVSKTPVREALLQLRHIGLVEPTTRGLQVILPSTKRIRDAYELRAGVEGVAARYAATRATATELDDILELARTSLRHAQAHEAEQFREFDRRFHLAIAEATRNERLREGVANALVLTAALRERDVRPSHDSIACATEHVDVAQAIRSGNAELAQQRLCDHVLHVMSLVLAAGSHETTVAALDRH